MRSCLYTLACVMALIPVSASAEPRVYELMIPGVQCSYTSEKAEKAARRADPALYAKADPRRRTLVVRFEDDQTSIDAIETALAERGYPAEDRKQLR